MRWNDLQASRCSIARALSVVGDRWTLLLLREAFLGATRFEEFCTNTGASRHIIAERLATLTDHGVLHRRRYRERPPRDAYELTEKGEALYPVVVSLLVWGDRWMPHERGPSLALIHEQCGAVHPELHCPACAQSIDRHGIEHSLLG